MIILQNDEHYIKIDLHGGQINRWKNEITGAEYMFNGDPKYWAYSSPTLFPIIGSSYDQKYHFDNEVTTMPNHGILRQAYFTNTYSYNNEIVLNFKSNEETLKQYPYYFDIDITYKLEGNKLNVQYTIKNDGVVNMPFNFGLHPAFNVPIEKGKKFTDYKLKFSSPVNLKGDGPLVNTGLVSEIPLSYETFKEHEVWTYHNLPCANVGITDGNHGIDVSVVGFPVVAIWTPPNIEAPFVCIEPWLGLGHAIEKDLPFEKRDAIMNIKPNRKFILNYTIEVY